MINRLSFTSRSFQDVEEIDKSKQKKWTASQSREFSDLITLLAYMVLSCDTSPHMTHGRLRIALYGINYSVILIEFTYF